MGPKLIACLSAFNWGFCQNLMNVQSNQRATKGHHVLPSSFFFPHSKKATQKIKPNLMKLCNKRITIEWSLRTFLSFTAFGLNFQEPRWIWDYRRTILRVWCNWNRAADLVNEEFEPHDSRFRVTWRKPRMQSIPTVRLPQPDRITKGKQIPPKDQLKGLRSRIENKYQQLIVTGDRWIRQTSFLWERLMSGHNINKRCEIHAFVEKIKIKFWVRGKFVKHYQRFAGPPKVR